MNIYFYNNLENAYLKPHAPYYNHLIYSHEQELMDELSGLPDCQNISQAENDNNDRHEVIIYTFREGVHWDERWNVPEIKWPEVLKFMSSRPKRKTAILYDVAWDDPQVYIASFDREALFCENHESIWSHPLVNLDASKLYKEYFEPLANKVGKFESRIDSFLRTKEELNCDEVIVPVLYLETYRANGLQDGNGIRFVNNPLVVANQYAFKEVPMIQDRVYDCAFAGAISAGIYPVRFAFEKILNEISDLKIHNNNDAYTIYRNTRESWVKEYEAQIRNGKRKHVSDFFLNRAFEGLDQLHYQGYMGSLMQSKISVCCASIFGYPLKKYWESMSMGCIVVGQMPKYAEKYGIIDGVHMVSCTIDTLEKTIRDLLSQPDYMQKISDNARKLVHDRYSMRSYAKAFVDMLK